MDENNGVPTPEVVVPSAVEATYSLGVESTTTTSPVVDENLFGTYTCSDCHTTFTTRNDAAGFHCLYCGGKNVTKIDNPSFTGYSVLPFVDTMKDAVDVYQKKIRLNPFIPFSFRGKNILNSMRKIYLPCSIYQITLNGSVMFLGADKISNVKNAPMQKFEVLYSTSFEYDNLLQTNYSKIDNSLLSTIHNYNFAPMEELSLDSIQDGFLISSNVDLEKLLADTKEKVNKHSVAVIRANVNHQLKKLSANNQVLNVLSNKQVFVPVYFLNLKYKGKQYVFLMNGQTGEATVDLPIGTSSVIWFSIIVLVVIFVISYLGALFL